MPCHGVPVEKSLWVYGSGLFLEITAITRVKVYSSLTSKARGKRTGIASTHGPHPIDFTAAASTGEKTTGAHQDPVLTTQLMQTLHTKELGESRRYLENTCILIEIQVAIVSKIAVEKKEYPNTEGLRAF